MSLIEAEIVATCNALGYYDGNRYTKESDCIEAIKDLIRFLKRDNDDHEIRRMIGSTQVLVTDLVLLLKFYWQDKELLDVLLRLLVNLTSPALLLFNEELPTEKTTRNYYLELINYLQKYKQAFVDETVFAVLTKKLGELLQLDWENRQEEDRLVIERILILVRNILNVSADPDEEKRTDNDASVHDQILWGLHQSGMDDLLIYIASSDDENDLALHVLEIISLMFREQDAQLLASSGAARSQSEKDKELNELMRIRERELAEKKKKSATFYGARHAKFGGTYCIESMKSVSEKPIIYHRSINDIGNLSFDRNKKTMKPPRNRQPLGDCDLTRRSTLSIRLFLKEFCIEFIANAYNRLMTVVKNSLVRQKTQAHDESYYFWAMKFFMEFNRHNQFKIDLVSETMSIESFHFTQTQAENCFEMMNVEKQKVPLWSRRLHLVLKAYKELLFTLTAMDQSSASVVRQSAKTLKSKLFYNAEYREFTLFLIRQYNEVKMSKQYMKDLAEATHVVLKLLERFTRNTSHLVVQQMRRVKKAKPKKPKINPVQNTTLTETELEEIWSNVTVELKKVLEGQKELPEDVNPFDPAADATMEEQKAQAMHRIQENLRKKCPAVAVAIFRKAREVWPENSTFGDTDIQPEDEQLALRDIFFAPLPANQGQSASAENMDQLNEDGSEQEESEEEERVKTSEKEFSFTEFIKKFTSHKVVLAYSLLLRQFDKNTAFTNHCIAKMMHRIAWDNKMPGMFFQASIFRTFQRILHDPNRRSSQLKDLATFAKFIVEKFTAFASANEKVFMEMLFWKDTATVYEIENGYGTYKSQSKGAKQLWTSEQEDELQRLCERYNEIPEPEQDLVSYLMENIIDHSKTRRQIQRQLKNQGLLQGNERSKMKSTTSRPPKEWQEQELAELTLLYQQNKDSMDVLGRIMDNLSVKRPKQRVIEKLLELGVVSDRKELRKKRLSKRKKDNENENRKSSDDDSDENLAHEAEFNGEKSDSSDDESTLQVQNKVEETPMSLESIQETLRTVLSSYEDGVYWIIECLQEAVEDRLATNDMEPVPIVPISASAVTSVNNVEFKKFMRICGLAPPSNEQEKYWRIPSTMPTGVLKQWVDYLQKLKLDDIDSNLPTLPASGSKSASKKKQYQEKLKEMTNAKKKLNESASRNRSNRKSRTSRRSREDGNESNGKRVVDNSSLGEDAQQLSERSLNVRDQDSDDDKLIIDETVRTDSGNKKRRTKRIVVLDSDEEENPEVSLNSIDTSHLDYGKVMNVSVSEPQEERGSGSFKESCSEGLENVDKDVDEPKKRKLIVDSSDDECLIVRSKTARTRVVLSDSE